MPTYDSNTLIIRAKFSKLFASEYALYYLAGSQLSYAKRIHIDQDNYPGE